MRRIHDVSLEPLPVGRVALRVLFQGWLLRKGLCSVRPPSPPRATEPCEKPLTGQHGDEGQAVILWASPVASFSEHVSVEHLMVEPLDPGLGEHHQPPAGLDLLHELFLQRGAHEKVTR